MIGRKLPNKGGSTFALGAKEDHGDHLVMRGATHCGSDAIDGTFVYPKNWNNAAVLWLSLKGEDSIINKNGELTPAARKLLGERYAIACPKLYLQGATRNPNVYANGKRKVDSSYEGFAGYHYGYNPSLLAERVRDALGVIAMIRDNEKHRADRILVAGVEGAGVIAAAAAALSGSAVNEVVTDIEGFRFRNLKNVWDVNFLPGAVKYGDVPGILSLVSAKTTVLGEKGAAGADAVVQAVVDRK
jgi:hypothetical protein